MMKLCPECKGLSVEFDSYHRVEKCLNRNCGWVNRDKQQLGEPRDNGLPQFRLSAVLERRNNKRFAEGG